MSVCVCAHTRGKPEQEQESKNVCAFVGATEQLFLAILVRILKWDSNTTLPVLLTGFSRDVLRKLPLGA